MKKRILSLLLVAVMLLGLLPTVALAAETGDDAPTDVSKPVVAHEEEKDPIHIVKSVSGDTLTLEAYVTNPLKIVTDTVPLDIALVLDVSDSMAENITARSYEAAYDLNGWEYYYQTENGSYAQVYHCDGFHRTNHGQTKKVHEQGWFTSFYGNHTEGNRLTPRTSEKDTDISHTQFYRKVETTPKSKLEVLKTAVNSFIGSVSSESSIALVKFAGDTSTKVDNETYQTKDPWGNGEYTVNYTQIVKGLTKVGEGAASNAQDLKDAVNKLSAGGPTRTDNAMEMAEKALEDATNQKVVIVFTDGEPTKWNKNTDNSGVASNAVNTAKTLKGDKTLIYTIAVADGANPADVDGTSSRINPFLHAVSSNYPNATASVKEERGQKEVEISLGEGSKDNGYYRVAKTGGELSDIFTQISDEVSSLTLKMGTDTILSDTLSQYFTFKNEAGEGNTYGIEVYTAEAETNTTALVWKEAEKFTEAQLHVDPKTKTITVTNFDYGENAVTIDPDGYVLRGKKLIVEIPIAPNKDYDGWLAGEKFYPTNSTAENSKAGLSNYAYKDTPNDKNLSTKLNESPNAPVTAYMVTYVSETDPKTDPKPTDLPRDPEDDRNYITGQTVTVAEKLSATGWTFTGWAAPAGVTVGNNTFTMGNKDVQFTGVWTKNPTTAHVTINKTFENADAPTRFGLVLKDSTGKEVPLEKAEGKYEYTAELEAGEYTLTEVNAAKENMKHAATLTKGTGTSAVEVSGAKDANGVWTFEIKITNDDIENSDVVYNLVNTYTYYTPAKVELDELIKKTLNGDSDELSELDANQKAFTVKLTPGTKDDVTGSYTWDTTGIITGTADCSDKGETVSFRGFKEDGVELTDDALSLSTHLNDPSDRATWYYLVEEVAPAGTDAVLGMDYDSSKYILAITVSKDNDGEKFNHEDTVIYTYDKVTGTATATEPRLSAITFKNSYAVPTSGAEKHVITEDDYNYIPDSIEDEIDVENVSFPKKDGTKTQLVVDKSVDEVTLLYKVTVTGTKDAEATVSDPDATWVGAASNDSGGAWVEPSEEKVKITFKRDAIVTLYYTKTFTRGEDFPGEVFNTAIVNGTDVPSEKTTIKDKTPGGLDFSDIILKDLYVTGDQNFPESLTFRAKLTLEDFDAGAVPNSARDQIAVQSLTEDDPREKEENDESVEAFLKGLEDEDWEQTLYATFYPENVTFDAHNKTPFTAKNGSHLYLEFPVAGQYTFRVEEINDKEDGVEYDAHVYKIVVHVATKKDGKTLYVNYWSIGEIVGSKTEWFTDANQPITFYNEVDTGEIPYYPIIPIIAKDDGKLNKTDHFAYIIGYPDGTVHPNGEITRAEVATIFFRLLKDEVRDAYFTSYNTYSDVQPGKWYNNPISTMSALGIINGYPDGTFRPDAPITRAEFAAIAARFDETATRGTATFTDIYGHWAADEIATAYGNDWIKGYPDGTFRPDRNITRAEAMALINRVLERAPESPSDLLPDMNKWSDNMDTSKWYYLDIQEATNSHDYIRKTFDYELWKRMLLDPDWSRYER